ncbi:MAG: archaetidylserine decarboxylase [Longimicrobiales bacterium]
MSTVPAVAPELPSAKWRAILRLLKRLPQAGLSRGFGRVADTPIPAPLRKQVFGAVVAALGIDLDEAELPLEEYRTINELFVRKLKPGVRTWPTDAQVVASPVDGIIGHSGIIENGLILQAKGRYYSPAELLDDAEQAKRFDGGAFLTIYLSPRHYHRIHAPTPGVIPRARHVPGALLPVNDAAVVLVDRLFARNERLICYVEGAAGQIAIVAVGAYNVGRISAAFDPHWSGQASPGVTNRKGALPETHVYDPPRPVATGAEIMAFHLGSTVVLLVEKRGNHLSALTPGAEVRLGQPISRA